jgi:hypothetical protein
MHFRPEGCIAPEDLLNYFSFQLLILSEHDENITFVVESYGCVFQEQLIKSTHTLEIHRCRKDVEFRNTIHALLIHIYITIKYQNT